MLLINKSECLHYSESVHIVFSAMQEIEMNHPTFMLSAIEMKPSSGLVQFDFNITEASVAPKLITSKNLLKNIKSSY